MAASSRRGVAASFVAPIRPPRVSIQQVVQGATERFLNQPESEGCTDLHDQILVEVETALLTAVLDHTDQNQSETARILGLNRGTLRKKMLRYKLI